MRGKIVLAGLILSLTGVVSSAQDKAATPTSGDLYCAGTITTESVPRETYVITGEESNRQVTFNDGDYVFINKGSDHGVKPGDEFSVIRPIKDVDPVEWTKWQNSILRKMGTMWEDEGRLKVVVARPDVSIAQVNNACNYVERGDIVVPFTQYPAPPLKSEEKFDRFATPNGKALAMVIAAKQYQQQVGNNDIIYVNLGNSQGVKVGDYFRIFRYQGTQHEIVYQTPRYAFDVEGDWGPVYGFGRVPLKHNWNNVPREAIGEGVVLRTGPNSSTVLITFALREIYTGDYVELE
jgi:hypothetical protein